MNNLNHRTFLGGSLGVAAIGLLAACTSNDSSSTSGSATASASAPTGALAFDTIDLSSGENNLFGLGTTEALHFTEFSAEQAGETAADFITWVKTISV